MNGDYFVKEKSEPSQAHSDTVTERPSQNLSLKWLETSPHSSPVPLKARPGGTGNREVNTKSTHRDGAKSL